MRTEPDLSRDRLVECLQDRYRFDVDGLTFVPFGLDSWSYVATSRDGGRAFVKLSRREPSGRMTTSEVPLLAALAQRQVPVPRPMADRDGGFLNAVDGYEVQVLEYLDGHSLEAETTWSDELYARVAETVAAVHGSTGAVRDVVKRVEDYALPFLPGFAATLTTIERGHPLRPDDDGTVARLRQLVAPRASQLRAAIGHLQRLRDGARVRDSDDVLCHTDIWGSNLLLSGDGTLHLLDWNGALIGPPEGDLFMFAGTSFFPADRFAWFLDRYESAFRRVRLHAETFGFYFYRRNLEDLADFVGSVAEGRTEAMGPTATLRVIADLLAETPLIDGGIERLVGVLATAR